VLQNEKGRHPDPGLNRSLDGGLAIIRALMTQRWASRLWGWGQPCPLAVQHSGDRQAAQAIL